MGTEKGKPPALTARLEAFSAALDIYGYPRHLWPWLTDWALFLMHEVHGISVTELPRSYGEMTYADAWGD